MGPHHNRQPTLLLPPRQTLRPAYAIALLGPHNLHVQHQRLRRRDKRLPLCSVKSWIIGDVQESRAEVSAVGDHGERCGAGDDRGDRDDS